MKIAIQYIRRAGALLLMALLVFSCAEFEEYESTTFGPGPSVSLALVSAQDSSFTVSVTSTADGYASVILLPGTGNTVPENPEDLLTDNVASLASQTKKVGANQPVNFTFSGLIQWASWEVMAAANNADGKTSDVAVLAVNTGDSYGPVLSETDPGVTYDPVLPVGGPVVLIFDEPVLYDDSKELVFSEFYDGEDVAAGSVEVDGNMVSVTPGVDFTYYDYVMLSFPEGAFKDYAGNPVAEMTSYFDGDAGALVGLFWGVEMTEYGAASITPESDTVQTAFDIVITFDDLVDVSNVEDGDITISYADTLNTFIKGVLASEISATDNSMTITQSYTAASGAEVMLTVPAGILEIGYGNPNTEITAGWVVE